MAMEGGGRKREGEGGRKEGEREREGGRVEREQAEGRRRDEKQHSQAFGSPPFGDRRSAVVIAARRKGFSIGRVWVATGGRESRPGGTLGREATEY